MLVETPNTLLAGTSVPRILVSRETSTRHSKRFKQMGKTSAKNRNPRKLRNLLGPGVLGFEV